MTRKRKPPGRIVKWIFQPQDTGARLSVVAGVAVLVLIAGVWAAGAIVGIVRNEQGDLGTWSINFVFVIPILAFLLFASKRLHNVSYKKNKKNTSISATAPVERSYSSQDELDKIIRLAASFKVPGVEAQEFASTSTGSIPVQDPQDD